MGVLENLETKLNQTDNQQVINEIQEEVKSEISNVVKLTKRLYSIQKEIALKTQNPEDIKYILAYMSKLQVSDNDIAKIIEIYIAKKSNEKNIYKLYTEIFNLIEKYSIWKPSRFEESIEDLLGILVKEVRYEETDIIKYDLNGLGSNYHGYWERFIDYYLKKVFEIIRLKLTSISIKNETKVALIDELLALDLIDDSKDIMWVVDRHIEEALEIAKSIERDEVLKKQQLEKIFLVIDKYKFHSYFYWDTSTMSQSEIQKILDESISS